MCWFTYELTNRPIDRPIVCCCLFSMSWFGSKISEKSIGNHMSHGQYSLYGWLVIPIHNKVINLWVLTIAHMKSSVSSIGWSTNPQKSPRRHSAAAARTPPRRSARPRQKADSPEPIDDVTSWVGTKNIAIWVSCPWYIWVSLGIWVSVDLLICSRSVEVTENYNSDICWFKCYFVVYNPCKTKPEWHLKMT